MRHHTKDKGDIGVLKAQLDLTLRGFTVCLPLTEHAPFDLVVWKNGKSKTVQVKYRGVSKGSLLVEFHQNWTDRRGTHKRKINRKWVNIFCVYCPDTDLCYYFNPSKYKNRGTLRLRVEKPKNNQKANINFAKDFLKVPF